MYLLVRFLYLYFSSQIQYKYFIKGLKKDLFSDLFHGKAKGKQRAERVAVRIDVSAYSNGLGFSKNFNGLIVASDQCHPSILTGKFFKSRMVREKHVDDFLQRLLRFARNDNI